MHLNTLSCPEVRQFLDPIAELVVAGNEVTIDVEGKGKIRLVPDVAVPPVKPQPVDKPRFKHDCDRCKFIGHFLGFDCYVCLHEQSLLASMIARGSDEGREYASCPTWILRQQLQRVAQVNSMGGQPVGYYPDILAKGPVAYQQTMVLALAPIATQDVSLTNFARNAG